MGTAGNVGTLNSKPVSAIRQKISQRPLFYFILIHTLLFMAVFPAIDHLAYPDPGGLERWVALRILDDHQLPYVNFQSEYPPLAILSFVLPAIFFRSSLTYSLAFAAELCVADILILFLVAALAARIKTSRVEAMTAYTILILGIGPLASIRHDLLPALMVTAGLYAFIAGKNTAAWAIIGLGVMSKLYPLILAPILAIYYLYRKMYSELINGLNALLVVIFVLATPWLILNASGFLQFLFYHADRGLHSETIYASFLLIGKLLGLTQVSGVFNFGSWNLSSPVADYLAKISPYITVFLLTLTYIAFIVFIWRRRLLPSDPRPLNINTGTIIIRYSALLILIFIVTNKVFSPQYLIWLCPLLALIKTRWRYTSWSLFAVIGILTQYIFPYHYVQFELGYPSLIIIAAIRNLLMVALVVVVMLPDCVPVAKASTVDSLPDGACN